jgi:hypothetical protein
VRPRIVELSPADGTVGVRADTPVVVAFSRPMDRASVEGCLVTRTLGEVALRWNGAGDLLTIVPVRGLAYARGAGDDPALVAPIRYRVGIGASALDVAGNPIEARAQASFSTLRSLLTIFDADAALSGHIHAGGAVGALVTFDLGRLPPSAVAIERAELFGRLAPGGAAAALELDHLTYGTLGDAALHAPPHARLGPIRCQPDPSVIRVTVTPAVEGDRRHRAERAARSQYRFRSAGPDAGRLRRDHAELEVRYLVP